MRIYLVLFTVTALLFGCNASETSEPTPDPSLLELQSVRPVTASPVKRSLNPTFFGLNNGSTVRDVPRNNPAYRTSQARLRPGTIRFPGGTVANYWDWERGDFVCDAGGTYLLRGKEKPCKLPNGYQALKPKGHTLEVFKRELDRTGAKAVFVLNMLTKRPERTETNLHNSTRLLRKAREIGIEVEYIELGNEFYLSPGDRDASEDYQQAFPRADDYVREAEVWIKRLRHAFPEAKIAVIGADKRPIRTPEEEKKHARRNGWNAVVAEGLAGVADAITVHPYTGGGRPETFTIPTFLATPQASFESKREAWSALGGLELWLTEYNLFDRDVAIHGTWAHGLFAASQTLQFLREPRAELVHFHAGTGNAVFGAVFSSQNGFGYDNQFVKPSARPKTLKFGLSASGQTLELVAGALRRKTAAHELDFGTSAPQLPGGRDALVGWLFKGWGQSALVLNLSAREQVLDLAALPAQGAYVQRSAPPRALITGHSGTVQERRGRAGRSLRLPPYSVTRINR